MGIYLSKACDRVEKESGEGSGVRYVVGEMQGWRKAMEDAHIAVCSLESQQQVATDEPLSVFGVFDGHGGKEVALFTKDHFVRELLNNEAFKQKNYSLALKQTFHRIDQMLEEESIETLLQTYKAVPNPSDIFVNTENRTSDASGDIGNIIGGSTEPKGSITRKDAMELFEKIFGQKGRLAADDENAEGDEDEEEKAFDTDEEEEDVPTANSVEQGINALSIGDENSSFPNCNAVGEDESVSPMVPEEMHVPLTYSMIGGEPQCQLAAHRVTAGCTAVVAFKAGRTLFVANAGDSRGVLCRGGTVYALSEDHKPQNEVEINRIHAAGGFVNTVGRVNGNLNLSRSLGDLKYKQVRGVGEEGQIISAEPDITVTQLQEGDRFFILACDGIWDCLTSQEACDFVARLLDQGLSADQVVDEVMRHCLADNVRSAQGKGTDNMTFLLTLLE